MSGFNGYRSWAQWNVSLWLNNDEGLYREMKRCIRGSHSQKIAAEYLLMTLNGLGITHTPDGARYTVTGIRAAMVGA